MTPLNGEKTANRERILTVKELTGYIRMKMESDPLLNHVWVRGEISNFKHHTSGHMYFTLKDTDSRIRCVMFASQNQRLKFIPKDGMKVIACGNVTVYDRDGQYQFYVSTMQPDGIGNLYLAFEQLKQKLEEEGLFSPQHKKPLPKFPKAVGIITSPTGAAIRDILTTLKRRYPCVSVLVYPVLVQGEHAAESIARAIEHMNELNEVDLLIVGRGGGSLEELWAFNEEKVARSIFASRIPVISAVGHETDFTIADFVADVRAATPTAAAELAVPHVLELKNGVAQCRQRMLQGLIRLIKTKREHLRRLTRSAVMQNPKKILYPPAERLDRLAEKLVLVSKSRIARAGERLNRLERRLVQFNPKEQMKFSKRRLQTAQQQLVRRTRDILNEQKLKLRGHVRQLDALSPLKVMQRGFSLVYDEKEKKIIKSIQQVQPGDFVHIRVTDGKLGCQVWSMREETGHGTDPSF